MGWVHIFRFIMIQGILMATIIGILLDLLGMMAIDDCLLQIGGNILQIFVHACFGFAQVPHSFGSQVIGSFWTAKTGRIHGCAAYSHRLVLVWIRCAHR